MEFLSLLYFILFYKEVIPRYQETLLIKPEIKRHLNN